MKKLLLAAGTALLAACAIQPAPQTSSTAKLEALRAEDGPKPEFPGEAAAYWAGLHETPAGTTAAALNDAARREIDAREAAEGGFSGPNVAIEDWGPGNFGGRLRGMAIHPTTTSTLLIGSVSGGIWKSDDGGASWRAIDDFLPSLSVGSMLADPDDDDRVWVGTGEGFFNVDSAQGVGIMRSDDFGETWTLLASTMTADFQYVNRLARVPGTDILIAATRTGLFRSTNLGTSWTEVSGIVANSRGFVDLKVDPSDTTHLLAYHYGSTNPTRQLLESTDSGATWTVLGALSGVPTTDISRMEIAIGTDGTEYLSVSNGATQTRGLWRRAPAAATFVKTASNTAFIERQGWYDLILGVDPTDSDRVYMGAVDMFRTTNAGATITKQTFWNPGPGQIPQFVHADLHVVAFDPSDASTVYIGCDGGLFKSTDGGTTWDDLNNDLRVTQYYGIAAHPDGDRVIGGTQDNGSHLFFGDNTFWLQWFGGDGGFSGWDQQDTNFVYGATPFAGLFGSADGGASTAGLPIPNNTGSLFITPFTVDANDGNRMMVGTDNVFLSENVRNLNTSTWADVSGTLGAISVVAFDPHDSEKAYAGRTNGQLWRTTGLTSGGAWSRIDTGLPTASDITSVEVDRSDATSNTLYVTLADYGADRVWKTTNAGSSWTSIHGDLPDIPMFSVVEDPLEAGRLWLGSELGLFTTDSTTEGVTQWDRYSEGLAWTRVGQLVWADGGNVLWAGTHGRGIYRIRRSPGVLATGTVDDSLGCDPDGFLDEGETGTIELSVTNGGIAPMTSVMVSLASAYGGTLAIDTPPQAYGTLMPGESATMPFDVRLVSLNACLDVATLVATITDLEGTMSEESFDITLGADPVPMSGTLTEDGEDAITPFTTDALVDVSDWAPVATQANSGSQSWFAADVGRYADKSLTSPWLDVGGGTTTLTFALYYDMEGNATQYWDGVVLEMRTEDGPWTDIGNLSTVPYDGPLFGNNTIGIRDAWSGTQTTWRNATVDLGSTVNGERVQVRFRMVCDTGAQNVGFWVDDIAITNVSWNDAINCDDATSCNELFSDGFESGDTSAWSVSVP